MLGLGKGVIAARSQAMEDELDPLEEHEAENYEASWEAHIRRRALAALMRGKGKEQCVGKGKGGNDASDEMGPETPNGTETSKGEGKSKGKETTDATETVSHVD